MCDLDRFPSIQSQIVSVSIVLLGLYQFFQHNNNYFKQKYIGRWKHQALFQHDRKNFEAFNP